MPRQRKRESGAAAELLDELRERLRTAVGGENSSELDAEAHVEAVVETLRARGVLARRLSQMRQGAVGG